MRWVIYCQLVIFLGWHILKWDSQVYFIDLIITVVQKYVKKDASDLIDTSMCTEEILMKYLSFPLYISINMPGTSNCFFTGIRLNLSRPSLSGDSSKWKGYLCTSRVNRQGKMSEICLTVWALGLFNLVVLGLLPATLYVCILNGAQLLLKSQEESSLQSKKKTSFLTTPMGCLTFVWRFAFITCRGDLRRNSCYTPPSSLSLLKMEQRERIQTKSKLFYSCCTTNKQTSGSIQSGPLEGLWALPKRGKWWGMGCRKAGGDRGEARWRSCGC